MHISINVDTETASILEPEVLTEFHIQSPEIDEGRVAAGIGNGAAPAGDGHVWVSIEWITHNVKDETPEGWEEDFSGMVQYAVGKGWVNDPGTHLKAHIKIG